jgi:hypothetical protein
MLKQVQGSLSAKATIECSGLARKVGQKFLASNGAKQSGDMFVIPVQEPITQTAELFRLADSPGAFSQLGRSR